MPGFFEELKRRNVVRVGIAYVVIAWVIAQVAELALDSFAAPEWVMKTLLLLLTLGLPLALFFAWAFELTPEGIKKEKHVDRSQSVTHETGRKLDKLIIAVLVFAVGFLLVDKFMLQSGPAERSAQTAPGNTPAAGVDERSIAVLPFVDMSPAKDQEYFTDGLTENLLNALAQISEIKVAGRTSSFAFKNQNQDLRSIGEQLNVSNILEGSVQKAGNKVRITAQLVNAGDGFHLWSETFDRNLTDIFAVQDEITVAVVEALRTSILGEEEIDRAYSGDFRAYNAYLLGKKYFAQHNLEGWAEAIEQYEAALAIDPDMALAWAGLSMAISEQTGFTSGFEEGYQRARTAALKAIELDPNLPEGHLALAEIQRGHDWDWDAAEQSLRRALALRPGDADIKALLGRLVAIRGNVARALPQIEAALALDPLNESIQSTRAWMLISLGRLEEAEVAARRLHASEPERGGSTVPLSTALYHQGKYKEAFAIAAGEPLKFLRLTLEALALDGLGDREGSEERLQALKDEWGDDVSYQIAAIYSRRGDLDNAFATLERGYEIRDPGLTYIQLHTAFDPLRDDPRYDALITKMGFK